jgi:hypothetical protein
MAEEDSVLLAEMDGEIDAISGDDGAREPSGGKPGVPHSRSIRTRIGKRSTSLD